MLNNLKVSVDKKRKVCYSLTFTKLKTTVFYRGCLTFNQGCQPWCFITFLVFFSPAGCVLFFKCILVFFKPKNLGDFLLIFEFLVKKIMNPMTMADQTCIGVFHYQVGIFFAQTVGNPALNGRSLEIS